jgi:DNA-binding NarL/FixJ family response regulator
MHTDQMSAAPTKLRTAPPMSHTTQRFGLLSVREREVVDLLATGRTNQAIARVLGITEGTVKAHVGRILLKLGLESRTAAAVAAAVRLRPCECGADRPSDPGKSGT